MVQWLDILCSHVKDMIPLIKKVF